MDNSWGLLKTKFIIEILQGDTVIGHFENQEVRLAYQSGPSICSLSNQFGLHQDYTNNSRWTFFEQLMNYLLNKGRINELLEYLFSNEILEKVTDSINKKNALSEEKIQVEEIRRMGLDRINKELIIGKHRLEYQNKRVYIYETSCGVQVEAIKIQSLSNEYIKELPSRCLKDISEKNYDSVITKSRTLLEEVIEYKINEKNEQVQTLGDIVKMYNQFKELYNMKQNGKFDNRVNDLLNGLEKIINSVANLRNINSDAHGAGQRRVEIKEREARLIINSAMTVSEYILSVGR